MDEKQMYYVAFCGNCDENRGIRTWGIHKSKEEFDKWYAGKMLDGSDRPLSEVYTVIYRGDSRRKAMQACGIPTSLR